MKEHLALTNGVKHTHPHTVTNIYSPIGGKGGTYYS